MSRIEHLHVVNSENNIKNNDKTIVDVNDNISTQSTPQPPLSATLSSAAAVVVCDINEKYKATTASCENVDINLPSSYNKNDNANNVGISTSNSHSLTSNSAANTMNNNSLSLPSPLSPSSSPCFNAPLIVADALLLPIKAKDSEEKEI